MAIQWTVEITPIDVQAKTASIKATRYDDVTLETENHLIISAVLNTAAQKSAILNGLWQQHLDYQTKQTAIAEYIGGLEAAAKANLEAREV